MSAITAIPSTPPPSLGIPQHPRPSVIIYLRNQMTWPKTIFSRDRVFALFLLRQSLAYARTRETGRASATNTHAALTQLPLREATWLQLMLPKSQRYTKLWHLSVWPLLESS